MGNAHLKDVLERLPAHTLPARWGNGSPSAANQALSREQARPPPSRRWRSNAC